MCVCGKTAKATMVYYNSLVGLVLAKAFGTSANEIDICLILIFFIIIIQNVCIFVIIIIIKNLIIIVIIIMIIINLIIMVIIMIISNPDGIALKYNIQYTWPNNQIFVFYL